MVRLVVWIDTSYEGRGLRCFYSQTIHYILIDSFIPIDAFGFDRYWFCFDFYELIFTFR